MNTRRTPYELPNRYVTRTRTDVPSATCRNRPQRSGSEGTVADVRASTKVEDDTPSSSGSNAPTERRHAPRSPLIFRTDATFPPLADSPLAAQQWCQDAFREWGVTLDVSAVLTICEDLVRFATTYGSGEIRVQLSSGQARITIAVTRRGLRAGQRLPETARRTLARVAETATSWGARVEGGDSGTVWAEVLHSH